MGGESCVVSKKQLSDEHVADLRLCSEAREVEQVSITSCVEKNPVLRRTKGVAQQQGEEYPKEGGSKHAALFDSV